MMRTLEQHNENVAQIEHMMRLQNKAGVLCDKCGTEMVYEGKTAIPGYGQHVYCPKCNHRGFKRD